MPDRVDPRALIGDVQALLRKWDPIGVLSGEDAAFVQDEYDGYAPVVLAILMRGTNVKLLADHLEMLRTKQMGMPTDRDWDELIAGELVAWWSERGT